MQGSVHLPEVLKCSSLVTHDVECLSVTTFIPVAQPFAHMSVCLCFVLKGCKDNLWVLGTKFHIQYADVFYSLTSLHPPVVFRNKSFKV